MKPLLTSLLLGLTATFAQANPAAPPFQSCMNLSNALEAETEGHWGYTIREADIARIADAGFDAIRIPIRWSAHAATAPPHSIDPAFFARIDEVIAQGLSRGLHVIINNHHHEAFMANPAQETPRLLAIWSQIASRYAHQPTRLIFELLNEPTASASAETMNALNPQLIATIRQTNPERWVIYSGANWGGLGGLLDATRPKDPKLIASFHYYSPFSFTHQGAEFVTPRQPMGARWGSKAEHKAIAADLAAAARYGADNTVPVFLGEFGAHINAPPKDRAHWLSHVRRGAEDNGIAWCHWGWASEFATYDAKAERWNVPIKDALLKN